ncbi:30S ribosomal protein S9, partial [Candidatus Bipolaricaulota bacterium]|nr:30S ribosomal protein S9 [Candidatus Bipolaricaulota bacterium]
MPIRRRCSSFVAPNERRLPKHIGNAIHAIGRRKRATARVYLTEGDGKFLINRRPAEEYFASLLNAEEQLKKTLYQPFYVTRTTGSFDV